MLPNLHSRNQLCGIFSHYFPMQNWLKIESSKSSVAVLPTISPTALTAMRKSSATSSSVASAAQRLKRPLGRRAGAVQRVLMP